MSKTSFPPGKYAEWMPAMCVPLHFAWNASSLTSLSPCTAPCCSQTYCQIAHVPNHATMAVFLGVAIGVMVTVSMVELVIKNAMEHNALLVLASTSVGALAYYLLEPLIPGKSDNHHNHNHRYVRIFLLSGRAPIALSPQPASKLPKCLCFHRTSWFTAEKKCKTEDGSPQRDSSSGPLRKDEELPSSTSSTTKDVIEAEETAKYLRLGLLMALTMTL